MASIAQTSGDRSVSVGRIFERAFSTIRHNPGVTFGLAFLFGLVPTLLSTYLMGYAPDELAAGGITLISLTLFNWALSIVITALTQAALTRATVAQSEGRRASFGESLSAAVHVLIPAVFLALVIGFAVVIGLVLLVVPGVILYIMWSVATPALVEERRGVFGSLARSRELTKGARWRIFGVLLVLLVIYWLFSAIVGFGALASGASLDAPQGMSIAMLISSAILGLLMNLLWGVVQASLYVELRDARDGPAADRLEEIFA